VPHRHDLAKLVTVIGASDICCLDKFLAFPAKALDRRLPKTDGRLCGTASELNNVEEKKRQATTLPLRSASSAAALPFFWTYFTQVLVQS
jgi:hypothetical protein